MTTVRRATGDDVPAVIELVVDAGLPTEGVAELLHAPNALLVAQANRDVIGCVGLEAHGSERLLRSLAVAPRWRREGIGAQLVRAALSVAGSHDVLLLTETAYAFFAHLGFTAVDRRAVNGPLATSSAWTRLCPESAVPMKAPKTQLG